jgi:hypothetical protein
MDSLCCRARGFVGAIIRTLQPGYLWRSSAATSSAMTVVPRAVGRTTSVLASRALSTILFWYSLSSTAPSLTIG